MDYSYIPPKVRVRAVPGGQNPRESAPRQRRLSWYTWGARDAIWTRVDPRPRSEQCRDFFAE